MWLHRAGEGSLWLSPEEWTDYRALVAEFARCYAEKEQLSIAAIQDILQDCIFDGLDLSQVRGRDFPARLAETLGRARGALTEPATPHTCCIQVAFMEFGTEPACMGDVRFEPFDEALLDELNGLRRNVGALNYHPRLSASFTRWERGGSTWASSRSRLKISPPPR
jgi:hypothetical protein